jgi:hypothetical protein
MPKKKNVKAQSVMSPEAVRAVVVSKIELMELLVGELLVHYVKEESALGGHLQHVGNRLDAIMRVEIDSTSAFKKVRRRW